MYRSLILILLIVTIASCVCSCTELADMAEGVAESMRAKRIHRNRVRNIPHGKTRNLREDMTEVEVVLLLGIPARVRSEAIVSEVLGATTAKIYSYSYSDDDYFLAFLNNSLICWGSFRVLEVLMPVKVRQYELRQAARKREQIANLSEEQLQKYFDENIETLDPIEGIWTSENGVYRIGIIKDRAIGLFDGTNLNLNRERDFIAIVVSSGNAYWQSGQVKVEFRKDMVESFEKQHSAYIVTAYYMSDHSKQATTAFIHSGILRIKLKDSNIHPTEGIFVKNYPTSKTVVPPNVVDVPKVKTESQGSGFLLAKSGLIVTNHHIIEGSSDIEVIFPQKNIGLKAEVALKDTANDLAVLKVTNPSSAVILSDEIPYLIGESSTMKLGQEVFTIGFPLGDFLGKSAKVSSGIINSLYGIQDDPRCFQISNPVQPGNSGGPLFNSKGELVGIVVSTLRAGSLIKSSDVVPQNVNFAIKSDYLSNLISMLPEADEIRSRKNLLSSKSLAEQIEMLIPFMVTVKAR